MKKWFEVLAEAGGKVAKIAIRGIIGEWGTTDRDLIAQVEALGEVEEITVVINSRGGEVDHAISIFNFLRAHSAKIIVRVEGMAASSASLIAMAGDEIIMPANTLMMIHNPWTFAAGNADQLRATADMLDKFEGALREVYVARTGKSEDEIKAMLKGEDGDGVFMTAKEAKEAGFCDVVEAVEKKDAAATAQAFAAQTLGIPVAVLAKLEASGDEPAPDSPDPEPDPEPETPVAETLAATIKAASAKLGMSEFDAVFVLDARISDAATAAAVIGEAREVSALCEAAGKADLAAGFIKSGKTLADARKSICDARADADADTHVDTTQPSSTGKPAIKAAKPAALKTAEIYASRHKTIH